MSNKLKIQWMLERGHDVERDQELISLLDNNNFECILIRTGSIFEDPWMIASKYASMTKNIKFMIAVNPAMVQPAYCAIQVATFQKIFGNRILINVVSGASTAEQAIFNDYTPIKDRYRRSAEFAKILKTLVVEGKIDEFNGNFYKIKNAEIENGQEFEIVFAGSSDNTINLANEFGQLHLYAMESSNQYIENRHKIKVDSAIKTTIIVEESSTDAWQSANDLLSLSTPERIEELKRDLSTHESQNQKKQQALHNFSKENLKVEENIWAGLGLLRGGGISAMVGNYQEVADLIEKFYNSGLNRILIGSTPEIYYVKRLIYGVMPILKKKGII
jgi:alkanesulfonate monooxygenase